MHTWVSRWEKFWFRGSMEAGRLAALRVVVFALFGLDQLALMTAHGWRYGATDFNVPHLDWVGSLLGSTSAEFQTAAYLVTGFLSLCVAAGVAVRMCLVAMLGLYGAAYFGSLLDGYQHHYLLVWVLFISLFVPFHKAPGIQAGLDTPGRLEGVGVRLLYAQISIVYLFTAVTKIDPDWFNGWALKQQISTPEVRTFVEDFGAMVGVDGYALTAHSVMIWQALVAASFLVPKLRPFACVTGPLFHGMVEVIGLEIRWFSTYMIGLYYLLLFPDNWYAATARWLSRPLAPLRAAVDRMRHGPLGMRMGSPWAVRVGALGAGAMVWALPLPGSGLAAAAIAAFVVASALEGELTRSALGVQLVAASLVLAVPLVSGAAYDFYRYQGSDLLRQSRVEEATEAYRQAVRLNDGPESRHAKLGELLLRQQRWDEAKDVFARGLVHAPDDPRLKTGLDQAIGKR